MLYGVYGAAIGGGDLRGIVTGAAVGAAGGLATFGTPGLAALLINFELGVAENATEQRIAIDSASCKATTPQFNLGAAIMSSLGTMIGGAFLPFAGDSIGSLIGATIVGAPTDIGINSAANSIFPNRYSKP